MSNPESPDPSVTGPEPETHAGQERTVAPTSDAAPTWYDRVTTRLRSDPGSARLAGVLAPVLLTLFAGILRLWNLGHPPSLVFDETYYVKDAWSQWVLGYTAQWPDGADAGFADGAVDAFLTDGSFSVHPPLGKFLIGAGMALSGAESSFGWRISVALFGTALVLVLYLLAKTLTRSVAFATVAGVLLAVDGQAIVMSRVSLLDTFLAFFVLLAAWFVALDTRGLGARVAAITAGRPAPHEWGPVLWNRPWVVAAGAAAGCAVAVKWSGLYVLAAFGLYLVVADAWARHRAGVTFWPADALLRQGPTTFLLLVPVAVLVYTATWSGWLLTRGGWGRDLGADDPGPWSWVPAPLRSLWLFHRAIYDFHVGLTSEHGYASPAWQWPLLLRPTSMYYESADCGGATCVQNIYSLNNPLIWWAGTAAALWLIYRFAVRPRWQSGLILTGLAATYVPWLLYPERTIFQFYTVAMLPFVVLALTWALREIAGSSSFDPVRRTGGQRLVWVFLIAVLVLTAFWYPIQTATTVPYDFWRLHNWLPGWI
ncbi:dolichyl-phosphate-mannose--protein mannosyltransferase [Microbacterium xanthum]|uniref:dolichyl-phosphate-mannose--protein mannosyltransferase n=1 Tax=Microbacterium xanthum TaxID=3079794 RepID=UPI002AD59255|nr:MULTISPECIES: phospholipid carrier-dependent glycosyltransferase [unclassified Microbacterium]MDZ8173280.1 phospholipid carrier-dependent glycosyltransferase [Microbacterium sp. KSW-48]MDZ8202289.1 phospholipid carrier-dependent glycosyltransferase [Microbacterium sp. SSW1-59]